VAIHESFKDPTRPWEFHQVPDPKKRQEVFWIHQYKLLEGIDDPCFQMLALFQPLHNARSFIQQVGRIIRNPSRKPNQICYVLDHSGGLNKMYWEGFKLYDLQLFEHGEEGLSLAIGEGWIERFMTAQPEITYIDGMFRSRFDILTIDPFIDIQLPCKINLIHKLADFSMDNIREYQINYLEEKDCLVNPITIDSRTMVILYVTYNNSQFLKSSSYIEDKLGIIFIREYDDLIAYFNSSGFVPINEEKAKVGKAYNTNLLKKLFRKNNLSKLTSISLYNSNLGVRSIRSKSISASSIEETALGFDDYSQILTTATGYSVDSIQKKEEISPRRYVGFSRGRIADSFGYVDLQKYISWLDYIFNIIKGKTQAHMVFNRYAPGTIEIKDPEPINILLDLDEVLSDFVTTGTKEIRRNKPISIEDYCVDINDGIFNINANEVNCEVKIIFNRKKKKYELNSPTLDELYSNSKKPSLGLVDYLNKYQAFRIIPKTYNSIYTLGQFYEPIMRVGKGNFDRDNFELGNILIPSEDLRSITSEKGNSVLKGGNGWVNKCLFGVIDNFGKGTSLETIFETPDIVVCDDMGTEIADFILAYTETEKIVFIHAKASSNFKPFSASALQGVCSQATKNIGYLNLFNTASPPKLNRWDGAWKGTSGQVNNRIRRGVANGRETWQNLSSIIRNPNADREVWLFLGQLLSKEQFINQLDSVNPNPAAIQALYLLLGTLSQVASVGAKLKIFCSP